MSTPKNPDSHFQLYIQHFAHAFGIEQPEYVLTETREVLAGSVRFDTLILFPEEFDFTSLADKLLPYLVENKEVAKAMKFQLFGPPRYDWIFEGVAEKPQDYQEGFYQTALEKMMITTSPEQIAQKVLGATSHEELVQKVLGAASREELAQKALGAASREELAQKALGAASREELAQKALGAASREELAQKALGAASREELAQKALGAASREELAQKALGAASREELVQKALGASSPFEAALKLVKSEAAQPSEEERRQLLAWLLAESPQDAEEE